MSTKIQYNSVMSIFVLSFIVLGSLVGAGILALPVCLGIVGVIPSVIGLIVLAVLMIISGIIISDNVNLKKSATFDLPSLYEETLGKKAKWFAIFANLVLLYGFLIAYLSGLTSILSSFASFPSHIATLVVFAVLTFFNIFGIKLICKTNGVLVITIFITFAVLSIATCGHIDMSNLKHMNLPFMVVGIPVILGAFYYHNVIPVVCRNLDYNRKKVNITIILGVSAGLIMTLVWTVAAVGVLPLNSSDTVNLIYAYKNNEPATIPMMYIFNSKSFKIANIIFAVVAMTTSYWGFGTGLSGYIRDLRSMFGCSRHRGYNLILCFVPPLLITLMFPRIFIVVIALCGGICVSMLFGFLPGVILIKEKSLYKKVFAGFMIIIFLSITVLIVLDKLGVFRNLQPLT